MPYASQTQKDTQELVLPPVQGTAWGNWAGLVKYDQFSRYGIDDTAADDLQNWLPMGSNMRQTPAQGATIATLPSGTAIWVSMQELAGGVYFFVLSSTGHLYQISLGGTITDCAGATSLSVNTQITNWQGTTILVTDPNVSKIYSWNGTTFATVFSSQQASFLSVYQGHLWMAQGNTITWTDTNSFTSLGGVAGSLIITDYDCLTGINALYPFGGLLYIFGPSFIQVIGNLFVSGSPAVLQFSKYTLEAQIGTVSQWSIQAFGQNLYFASKYGIWMINGAIPLKVSQPLDGFFQFLDPASSFSAGYAEIYNIPCLFWNMKYTVDGTYRNFGVTNTGIWFSVVSGTVPFISSFNVSGIPNLYGTDGTNLFQLLSNTTASVTSVYNSKYLLFGSPIGYDNIQYLALFLVTGAICAITIQYLDDNGNVLTTLTGSASSLIGWVNNFSNTITWLSNSAATVTWTSSSATQQNIFQFDGPGRLRSFAFNSSVQGTGIYLQNVSVGSKKSEAGWGN